MKKSLIVFYPTIMMIVLICLSILCFQFNSIFFLKRSQYNFFYEISNIDRYNKEHITLINNK